MLMSTYFLLFSCLVCTQTPLVKASPLPKSPDLSTMLQALSGGDDIHSLLKFIKEFKTTGTALFNVVNVNPSLKEIIDNAANKNVKLGILMKIAKGHFPDMLDLYQLTRANNDSISNDIYNAARHNQLFLKAVKGRLPDMFKFLTGHNVNESYLQSLLDGTIAPTDDNIPARNALEMAFFMKNSWSIIKKMLTVFFNDPTDVAGMVSWVSKMDLSPLSQILVRPGDMTGEKYSVRGKGTQYVTDPDVVQGLKDVKYVESLKGSDLKSEGESIVMEVTTLFLKVFDRVVTEGAKMSITNTGATTGQNTASQ